MVKHTGETKKRISNTLIKRYSEIKNHTFGDRRTELSQKYPESYENKSGGSYAGHIVKGIKGLAKHKGIEWNLTQLEAYELCLGECYYCGIKASIPHCRNGIDRIDNNVGYEKYNCVSCCESCNSAKLNNSLKYFKTWISRVYNIFILTKSNNMELFISNTVILLNNKILEEKFLLKERIGNNWKSTDLGLKYPQHYNKGSMWHKKSGKYSGSYAAKLISDFKLKARKRKAGKGIEWKLDDVYAFELCISDCFYCGEKCDWPNTRNGIDRINNDIGYEINNCVPCCRTCNVGKNDLPINDFKDWIIRLHGNLKNIRKRRFKINE